MVRYCKKNIDKNFNFLALKLTKSIRFILIHSGQIQCFTKMLDFHFWVLFYFVIFFVFNIVKFAAAEKNQFTSWFDLEEPKCE